MDKQIDGQRERERRREINTETERNDRGIQREKKTEKEGDKMRD